MSLIAHSSIEQGIWFLDSGASNHMTGRKNFLTELYEKVRGETSFSDLSKVPV